MARQGLVVKRSYEDFEPFCRWERTPEVDILHVHLQGYKRQQLKIQLNSVGVMTITGERCLDSDHNRWARFTKETRVPDEIKTNAIHAKLSSGILSIFMPKNAPVLPLQPPESADAEQNQPQQQQERDSRPNVGDSRRHQREDECIGGTKDHWMMKLRDVALVRSNSGILAVVAIVAVVAVLVGYGLRTSYSHVVWGK